MLLLDGVDDFTRAYPGCRYVVTSRIVGYTEASQLAAGYATTTVRDFSLADVRRFLAQWHRLIAIEKWGRTWDRRHRTRKPPWSFQWSG